MLKRKWHFGRVLVGGNWVWAVYMRRGDPDYIGTSWTARGAQSMAWSYETVLKGMERSGNRRVA